MNIKVDTKDPKSVEQAMKLTQALGDALAGKTKAPQSAPPAEKQQAAPDGGGEGNNPLKLVSGLLNGVFGGGEGGGLLG